MKKTVIICITCGIALAMAQSAMALGIGGYVEMGVGRTGWSGDADGTSNDITPMGGIMIDTAVAKDRIFNYRIKFGGGKMLADTDFMKIGLVQEFGVSPANLRGDQARFWFGPRIGIHYVGGEITMKYFDPVMLLFFGIPIPMHETIKVNMCKFDLGLVLAGFNFNLGSAATLTFEFGINYGVYAGSIKGGGAKGDSYGNGYEGFADIGFMYRMGDIYTVKPDVNRREDTNDATHEKTTEQTNESKGMTVEELRKSEGAK